MSKPSVQSQNSHKSYLKRKYLNTQNETHHYGEFKNEKLRGKLRKTLLHARSQ